MTILGIDVSHFQGDINWASVSADQQNISFAYIKASEGATFSDPNYSKNYAAAKTQNLLCGAYHFFKPDISIPQQVDIFLTTIGSLQVGDLPPALDVEAPAKGVDPSVFAQNIQTWLTTIQDALNCTPIIYTTADFWNNQVQNKEIWQRYPLWIAQYTSNSTPDLPAGASQYSLWQYSNTGIIKGITGNVDLDQFNGDVQALKEFRFSQ